MRIEEPSQAHVTILANDDSNGIVGFEKVRLICNQKLTRVDKNSGNKLRQE